MAGLLKDYVKIATSLSRTRYGYGALGVLTLEIMLKDAFGIPKVDGAASSALMLGNGLLGVSSCISLVSAGFGMRALRAYHYGQRTLRSLWEVDGEFWEGYARADACTRRGLDLALDEVVADGFRKS